MPLTQNIRYRTNIHSRSRRQEGFAASIKQFFRPRRIGYPFYSTTPSSHASAPPRSWRWGRCCALSSALTQPVSPQTMTLSLAPSVGGILGGGAHLRRSSNPDRILSSYSLLAGVMRFFTILPPLNPGWHPFAFIPGNTGALALFRPVVPHTLTLSEALSAGDALSSGALQCFSCPTGRVTSGFLAGDRSSFSKL